MKIAQVCPYDFSRHGGVKTHVLQLSNELRSIGHEVHIIAPKGAGNVAVENLHCFGKNVSMPFLGTKIDVNIAMGSERKKLKDFLRKEKFDVIHYHTIWNPIIPFQILTLSRAKNIATFHDTPKNNTIGRFIGRFVMPLMARIIFMKLSGIISVSKSQAGFISRFSKRKISIIPNGIVLPSKRENRINPSQGERTLLFLGRLEPRKGIISALKAYKEIQRKVSEVRFIVAGEGDLLQEAKDFARENTLVNVEFIGKVNDEQKWELFSLADVYVASAEYGESFGIVLLEAMSRQTLLSGYANEGYKNVIGKKQMEFFVPPGDYEELANKTINLLSASQDLKNELREEGDKISNQFDWRNLVGQVIEVYNS